MEEKKAPASKSAPKHEEEEEDQGNGNGYADEELECRDCGAPFTFTSGEQEFYATKGFDNKPVRCKACKDAKKSRMEGGGGRGGGGGGYGDRGSFGGRGGDRNGGGGGGGVCYAFQKGECTRGSGCRYSH